MWLQRISQFLLRYRGAALAIACAFAFLIAFGVTGNLLANAGILIATFITLVRGPMEGAVFTLAVTLTSAVSFYLHGDYGVVAPLLIVWGGMSVVFISNILTWVFAVMLRRQVSFSTLLQIAALVGMLFISLVHLAYPNVSQWWLVQLTQLQQFTTEKIAAATNSAIATAQPTPIPAEVINSASQFATGMMVFFVLVCAMLQLIVARWWQCTVYSRGTLKRELHGIRLSPLAGVSLILGAVLCYWNNDVALDIMPILCMLFIAAGLSLVHYLIALIKKPMSWFWIVVFYVVLILLMPQVGFYLLIMMALVDIWTNVRMKVQKY